MASSRPLLYMSLPGVAFILGVFWYRRRNKVRLADMKQLNSCDTLKTESSSNSNKNESMDDCITKSIVVQPTAAKSINIAGTLLNDDENRIFGKSAPIQIVQNGRSTSPMKHCLKQIDSEVLKSKIQNAENKQLTSIDEDFENLSSPVDLPDSIDNRMSLYSRTVDIKKEKPVVIIATTTPKISPENSFLESKYTTCEQNNNLNFKNTEENGVCEVPTVKSAANESCAKSSDTVEISKNDVVADDSKICISSSNNSGKEMDPTKVSKKSDVESSSPSSSLCSIQSGDSGKGSSLPRSEAAPAKITYEFFVPNSLVGKMYGRKRSYLHFIKSKTNASVVLRDELYPGKLRVFAIDGTESEVQAALLLIRQRLPAKLYPNLTMQRIHFALPQSVVPLSTESLLNLQLNLIESINNDVVVSAVVSGGHIFVQQPLHPTYPSLPILQQCLYESYTKQEAPLLPGIELNAVCVIPVNDVWYRVQIVDEDAKEADRCIVKFLDFGGYMNVDFNELRQIRSDFMNLPFQATECILSNLEPIDTCWSAESVDILSNLTSGIVLQAQIAGYNSQNIPEIYLFASLGPNNVIFINKELAARNLAKWVDVRD